jgi:hypothetical protein
VFVTNLIVNLPGILFLLAALGTGAAIITAAVNGNLTFTPVVIVALIGLLFLSIFVVLIVSLVLGLLRPFFWRVAVLEDAGVGESLRRGWDMAREHWKNAGLMWLVMIGLGIVWLIAFAILAILTIPVVLVTAALAAALMAIPYLLLVSLFSSFLGGTLSWIAAGLFVAPIFFPLALLPWYLLVSWQSVYTSTVWTLTYRELKTLPLLAAPPQIEPTPPTE